MNEELKIMVYEKLKSIPYGKVSTYKQIAIACKNKNYSRVIGNILHKNIDMMENSCYKVVNSKGKLSNNYAFGGIEVQKQLLEKEGIIVSNDYTVNLDKYLYNF